MVATLTIFLFYTVHQWVAQWTSADVHTHVTATSKSGASERPPLLLPSQGCCVEVTVCFL